MKIDFYSHVLTKKYLDEVFKHVPSPMVGKKMLETQPTQWDLDMRFRMMDLYEGYTQVIMMTGLPIESITYGPEAVDLARLANDEIAGLVAKYPSRFLCGTLKYRTIRARRKPNTWAGIFLAGPTRTL